MKNFSKKFHLIKSQIELIKALAKGETLMQTAINMGLNYYNLQRRTQLLYKKFNVSTRKDLINSALEKKIITTANLTNKFRKKYINYDVKENLVDCNSVKLTSEELAFLNLYFKGYKVKDIIINLPLKGKYHARCIKESLCRKFELERFSQIIKYYYMLYEIYGI